MGAGSTADRVTQLLSQLVSIDSVNLDMPGATNGEKRHSDFIACLGRENGPRSFSNRSPFRTPKTSCLSSSSPMPGRRFLFDIHLDTVPLGGARAGLDPIVEDGRLYGRGACDTKGSMAAALMALERLVADPPADGCDVALLGTVDEEYLKRGVDFALDSGLTADAALVGEPTNLQTRNRPQGRGPVGDRHAGPNGPHVPTRPWR